tara:strand:- start:525 stop:1763 length:1239 start_codon:yes stop_codon:yes gene_type:complete
MWNHFYKIVLPKLFWGSNYYLEALFVYALIKLQGSTPNKRLRDRNNINFLKDRLAKTNSKRLAIFVGYHNSNKIPESNLNYLNILRKTNFEIIYVHNGNLDQNIKKLLTDLGHYVICRDNVGQDMGAYKDVMILLENHKLTDKLNWILICNDSNFCIGGENAEKFSNRLSNILEKEVQNKPDFISLNCNYDRDLHHQSYFLCFSSIVFKNKKFKNFWKNYIPLNHRYHAIEQGEKKLTKKVLSKYKAKIMFTSHELCASLNVNLRDQKYLVDNLPKVLFYLSLSFEDSEKIEYETKTIIDSLENYNPSHVFGLLNILFMDYPFLKKDVVRQGTFSFSQIFDVLHTTNLSINEDLRNEIMDSLLKGGTSYSYRGSPKKAFQKGITPEGFTYDFHYISMLLRMKAFWVTPKKNL